MKNNKLLVIALAFVLLVVATLSLGISSAAASALAGDVNEDGMITTTDARWALQAAVEKRVLSGQALINADVYPEIADGKVTTTDARVILELAMQPLEVGSISMNTLPSKTLYTQGEAFDVTGASITVIYTNGSSETIDVTADMVSGYNASSVGTQTLTVTYSSKTTTFTVTVEAEEEPAPDTYGDGYNVNYLCGVDMFGRTFTPIQGFDDSKDVGIFYFLWHGQHIVNSSADVYDISALIAAGKEYSDVLNTSGTSLSPLNEYHYWGKPLFGYYESSETWVIRRHLELLTYAGVDFIVFDCTNGFTYDTVWPTILENLLKMQQSGWDVPKVAFYTNTDSTNAMNSIYNSLYGNSTNASKYSSLFYSPNGKPMIIGNNPSATVSANMDVRPAYWPQQGIDGSFTSSDAAGFPWMEWVFPQYNHNGIISVSVAQHPNGRFSDRPIQNYGTNNWGRGMDANGNRNASTFEQGQNFQRQWDSAVNQGASTIFVTGWNEWIALKHIVSGRVAFVDCYNEEFSRDIEPMSGGYEDSFYLQMIQNIRDYKGITGRMADPVSKTINISSYSTILSQWSSVSNIYVNPQSQLYKRSGSPVQGSIPAEDEDIYKTDYPLNNILSVKVTHDSDNIYMLITCQSSIKNYTSKLVTNAVSQDRWMNVFLSTGEVKAQGWEGYKYVINRSASLATATTGATGTGSICLLNPDGTTGVQVGTATISYYQKYVQISIPRSAVDAVDTTGFYFKVADNINNYLDINDYYISGKSFPMGRLSYYYYF